MPNKQQELMYAFAINRMVIFEVAYYTLGSNANPYFSTSAGKFIKSKRDYQTCGQCQEHVLPLGSRARAFWKKWNSKHLKLLTDEELSDLNKDLDVLKQTYKYISKSPTPTDNVISFNLLVALSKTAPTYHTETRAREV